MNNKIILGGLLILSVIFNSCLKESEEIVLTPDAGNSFIDIENDGYVVTLNAQPAPEGQTGTWRLYMGENGRFEDIHDPHSKFYGEPGEIYLLGWELSVGDNYKAETINVSFKPLRPVIISEPGDTIYNNISLKLEAEAPKYGATGNWEIIDGNGGRIENTDNHIADFIGIENEPYTIRWSLSYGSKEESVEVSFHTDTLRANAGEDNLDIITSSSENDVKYYNLNAVLPAGATGTWELLDGNGGRVYSNTDPHSVFEGLADSVYTMTWTVRIDLYESVDTLQLRFRGKWGTWVDPRDNQAYRFVKIGKLEWMAENFNYAAPWSQYGRNWYYGQTSRANIINGRPVETEEERKFYGRLYNYYGALDAAPEGWRLPTRKDFDELHVLLGGKLYAHDKLVLGGESGVDLNFAGLLSYSGGYLNNRDNFGDMDISGYFMTAEFIESNFGVYIWIFSDSGASYAAPLHAYFHGASVRYVRDVQ